MVSTHIQTTKFNAQSSTRVSQPAPKTTLHQTAAQAPTTTPKSVNQIYTLLLRKLYVRTLIPLLSTIRLQHSLSQLEVEDGRLHSVLLVGVRISWQQ